MERKVNIWRGTWRIFDSSKRIKETRKNLNLNKKKEEIWRISMQEARTSAKNIIYSRNEFDEKTHKMQKV